MANASPSPKASEQEQDLSMEEILQSIRRIIAEEGEEEKAKPAEEAAPNADVSVPGSDVLELTEMLHDDGSVESLKAAEELIHVEPTPPGDVLAHIDQMLSPPAEEPTPPAEEPKASVMETFEPQPALDTPEPVFIPSEERLLSNEAAAATAAALKKVSAPAPRPAVETPSIPFRSGETVEDLVVEALKPMLKAWLDANLPPMVERIVEREIRKLTN